VSCDSRSASYTAVFGCHVGFSGSALPVIAGKIGRRDWSDIFLDNGIDRDPIRECSVFSGGKFQLCPADRVSDMNCRMGYPMPAGVFHSFEPMFMRRIRSDSFLYPLLGGIFFAVSWHVPNATVFMLVSLVPLFLFAGGKKISLRRAFGGGMLFGVVALGPTLGYFFRAVPLFLIGIPDRLTSLFVLGIAWIPSAAVLALGPGIWAAVFSRIRRSDASDMLLAPSLWVLSEYIRASLFSLLWMGVSEELGPRLTYGFIGLPMADIPYLLPLAALGGSTLLGFAAVSVNAAIAYAIGGHARADSRRWLIASVPILLFAILPIIARFSVDKESSGAVVRAGIIGTNESREFGFSASQREESYRGVRAFFRELADSGVRTDVVILPESSGFMESLSPGERADLLADVSKGEPLLAIDSAIRSQQGKNPRLLLSYYDGSGIPVSVYWKRFILPVGEYSSPLVQFFGSLFGGKEWAEKNLHRPYLLADPNGGPISMGEIRGEKVAALLCSEIFADELYGQAVREGAGILANSASHSWFRGSPSLFQETLRRARIVAVSHHRFFLHAGNMVPSFVLDPDGRVRTASSPGGPSLVIDDIQAYSGLTPYDMLGNAVDALLFSPVVFFLVAYLISLRRGVA